MKSKKPVRRELGKVDEEFDHELRMLMNKFLYEVYRQILHKRLSKSALASRLQVTPGYLSQVFHSKKPLTFEMLVKMQRILNIEFEIKAKVYDRWNWWMDLLFFILENNPSILIGFLFR